jgi:hypothetical protein
MNRTLTAPSQSPTQKMLKAFFVSDLGNRAIGQSGNRAIGQSGNRAIGQSGNRAIGQLYTTHK